MCKIYREVWTRHQPIDYEQDISVGIELACICFNFAKTDKETIRGRIFRF